MAFFKPNRKGKGVREQEEFDHDILLEEYNQDPLLLSELPSQARVCFNVITIPESNSCKLTNSPRLVSQYNPEKGACKSLYQIEGLVLGSVSVSIFDEEYVLR